MHFAIPSAKEPVVLWQTDLFFTWQMQFIDHFWQFLASVCQSDKPSAHQPLVLWQTIFNCHFDVSPGGNPRWGCRRPTPLKTIGFKKRLRSETAKHHINHWFFCRRNSWDWTRRLKTIGLRTIASCETRRDALKPLVWRRAPAVRQDETP